MSYRKSNEQQKPLCFFERNGCKRTSEEHRREFSHDSECYNGMTASRHESCKEYPKSDSQKHLCFFARNGCKRTNEEHSREFSHDPECYNGMTASRQESCKEYAGPAGPAGPARPARPVRAECQLVINECPEITPELVKHAGIAFLTRDRYLVMIRENQSLKLNFPCGNRNVGERVFDCARRETIEELGNWNPFDGQNDVCHMTTVVRNHTSARTGDKSQSVIYVISHPQLHSWFLANFRENDECSEIMFMSIPDFRQIVNGPSCIMFRYPNSMKQIQSHIDAFL